MDFGFALFDTAIGRCALAWDARGVQGVQLPQSSDAETRARITERFPSAHEAPPPPEARHAIEGIVALLRGEARDLSDVVLDMEMLPPFHRRVYEAARLIPPGATLSYGELAARCGAPGAARAVGQALGRNPFAIIVPCHRVLAAGGRVGGFTANGGIDTKLRMLAIEGVRVGGGTERKGRARRFAFDPEAAVRHLREADPAMGGLIDAVGPFRMELHDTPSIFGAVARAIVYQQLTGKVAATIFGRFCVLCSGGSGTPTAEQVLRLPDDDLRSAGLSRAKVLAVRDLARRTVAGEVPTLAGARRMDDEAIVARLCRVRGVGRWTAQMVLIFRLGRPDVLPADDYGVRKGFAVTFRTRDIPTPGEVEERGRRWEPYRSVASWYLWRAAEGAATRGG